MQTFKSLALTLLLVIVFVGGSFAATLYARDRGWIKGKEIIEETDTDADDTGEAGAWDAAGGEAEWPYIVPIDGPAKTAAKLKFSYKGYDYTLNPQVDIRVYYGAVAAVRGYEVPKDADDNRKEELLMAYYNKLTYDPEMEPAIESLLDAFRQIKEKRGLSSDEYVELLSKYVQSIPYDTTRGSALTRGSMAGDPRMPIQVIVDGRGDCDEKVMLLATLLTHEGYEVNGLYFAPEKHMALGIQDAAGEGYEGLGYDYIETTGPSYVSEVPTEFVGGFTLQSSPVLIAFGDDSDRTGEYSQKAVEQVAHILDVRAGAMDAAQEKKAYIENTTMSKAQYKKEEAQYEACYTAENSFRATVDANGKSTSGFMDRPEAITWIKKNVWW